MASTLFQDRAGLLDNPDVDVSHLPAKGQ
jgi:hypothetical protein